MSEAPGQSTLVLEDGLTGGARPACFEEMLGSESADVLSVVYRGGVDERLDALRARSDSVDSAAVICVGPAAEAAGRRESAAVKAIPDPADLTGVGMAATEWVRGRDSDGEAIVCVDSLSTLVQYAETERAFRFLHALLGQFRTAGVDVHVHIDPAAHDERTVAQFRQLFDDVRRTADTSGASRESGEAGSGVAGGQAVATDGGEWGQSSDGEELTGDDRSSAGSSER